MKSEKPTMRYSTRRSLITSLIAVAAATFSFADNEPKDPVLDVGAKSAKPGPTRPVALDKALPELRLELAKPQTAAAAKQSEPKPASDSVPALPQPRTLAREVGGAHPTLSDPSFGLRSAKPPTPLGPIATRPTQRRIEVTVGMFHILTSYATIRVVAVGDPTIADVQVLSSRAALINGKKPGMTSVVLWDATGVMRQHELVVTGFSPTLIDEIRQALGLPEVRVAIIRDSVVLEGQVKDADQKARAGQIAAIFADKVQNLLTVREDPMTTASAAKVSKLAETVEQIAGLMRPMGVSVELVGEKVILRGQVETEDQRTRAEALAKQFAADAISLLEIRPYTEEELNAAIGLPKVSVRIVRDQVILDGDVENAEQSTTAATIAAKSGKTVVNRINLPRPPSPTPPPPPKTLVDEIREAVNESLEKPIRVRSNGANIILDGTVKDLTEGDRAYRLARSYVGQGGIVDTSLLMVAYANMVNLEMSVIEVNRDKAKRMGVEFPPLNDSANGVFTFGESVPAAGGAPNAFGPITRRTPLLFNVRAFASSGVGRILSQPNMTVMSGRLARFQVGGEIPIPQISTTGTGVSQVGVEYRPYGIIFDMHPSVLPQGLVAMALNTQVTSIDRPNGTTIGGSFVPAFASRTANTVMNVADGGTLGIGGLIDRRETLNTIGIPFISRLPVIGQLFQSRQFQRNESELIIFIKVKTTGQALPQPYVQPTAVQFLNAGGATSQAGGAATAGSTSPGSGQ